MAIDIMNTLVEMLCPTYSAAGACNNFINQPSHQVLGPLGPLLYFLFFPTVFLIIFIYIGTGVVLRGNVNKIRGMRVLLAVAFFVFIVLQGWYPMILWMGELWFFTLIIFFVLFFIVRMFTKGNGGGGGGMSGVGGVASRGGGWLKEALVGEMPLDPRQIARQRKLMKDQIAILDAQIKEQRDELKITEGERQKTPIKTTISELLAKRKTIEMKLKALGG